MQSARDQKKDEELNAASWEAARGALVGATKVRFPFES
jgi:hypothetical protein